MIATALLHEIGTGRKVPIGHTGDDRDVTPYFGDLDRRDGISFRAPCFWP